MVNLFLLHKARQSKDASLHDVEYSNGTITLDNAEGVRAEGSVPDTDTSSCLYAVTVNVKPDKCMNRKKWRNYTHDQQIGILTRIEKAFRRDNPSVMMKRLEFEECPTLKQIHFHALYLMPKIFVSTMEQYYMRTINGNDDNTLKPWIHLKVKEIYDEAGWCKYISKDIK